MSGGPATDWVSYHARRHPSRLAVESADTGMALTWAELDDRVGRMAGVLADRFGVRAGDRVVLLADNDPRLVMLQFACIRLGAVFVPMNWRLSPPELIACTTDAEPALVIHDQAWQQTGSRLAELAPARATWGCDDDADDLDRACETADPRRARPDAQLSDPVQILYTSGTTGTPKGAVITLAGISWHSLNITSLCEVWGRGERLLTAMPLFHAGGLNGLAMPVLRAGGSVTTARRFDPARMVELLADPARKFTHFAGVPVMYQAMLAAFDASTRFPAGIHAQVGGGYLAPDLVAAYDERGLRLSSAYGATEMGPLVSAVPCAEAVRKPGSCGYPVPHTQLRITADNGDEVADGESGELWVRGPSITPRYWRKDLDSSFTDGWFRTGDAVRRDDEGYLHLCGRLKDMYKSGGENVFTAEVENVLADHPDIAEVAVIGVPHARWGEVGRAVVVAREGTSPDLAGIEAHCQGRLARYKTPKSVVLVPSLPRNVTGKVVNADVRAEYGAEEL